MPSIKIEDPPWCAVQMGSVAGSIDYKYTIKFDTIASF